MRSNQENKFLKFVKANLYYLLVVLALGVMVLVLVLTNQPEVKNANTIVEDEKGQVQDVSGPVVNDFRAPLETFTILKDYSDKDLMYNASLKRWESHKSMDLSAQENANVLAIADGIVSQVYTNYLDGTVVVIEHDDGLKSLYGSLQEDVQIKVGDRVTKGQPFAKVGCSSKSEFSESCHLHFEMFRDGKNINPAEYVSFTDK